LLGVALATTALGTIVPILSDARLLSTPFGSAVLGTGVAGEFWPIIFISVFLTGVYGAGAEVLLLFGFGTIVMLAATAVLRARPSRVVRILQETVHTSGQTAVRASILLLATLVLLASNAGFEFVLGAFAAGLVVMAAALFGVTLVHDLASAIAYAALFGLNNAFSLTMFGYLMPRYFGRRHVGTLQGTGQMVAVVGASLGPLPVGLAFDYLGSPTLTLRLLALVPIACALAAALYLRTPAGVTHPAHLE